MNKKGQFGSLQGVIITIVIIGILLGLGLLIASELKENTNTSTLEVEMEQITTLTNATAQSVDYNYETSGYTCLYSASLDAVYNATDNSSVAVANYTFTSTTGEIIVAGWNYNGSTINVNYTVTYGDDACEAIDTTEEAIGDIPTWLAIVIVLILAGIILAIVFKVIPIPGRSGGGVVAEI